MHPSAFRIELRYGHVEIQVVIVVELSDRTQNYWFAQGLNYDVQGAGDTIEAALENLLSHIPQLRSQMPKRKAPASYHRHYAHAVDMKPEGPLEIYNEHFDLTAMDQRASEMLF